MLRPTLLLTLLTTFAAAWPSSIRLDRRKDEKTKKKNPKYFHEMPGSQELIHYDARYFAGEEVSYARHRHVLRGLVTSYLDFFQRQGSETWIAHGTLLGWWWNGHIMPWDLDLDVQVTAGTMRFMADNFNRTEHPWNYTVPVEHGANDKEELVQTKYLFDINPHHNDTVVDRMNIIDGRWIDMGTGMYIDLTVLRERDPEGRPGVWSCTNNHRYDSHDLWPLRVTEFEGVRALIPREFEKILADEYGQKGLTRESFHGHKWNHAIKQWVKEDDQERKNRLADAAVRKEKEMNAQRPLEKESHLSGDGSTAATDAAATEASDAAGRGESEPEEKSEKSEKPGNAPDTPA